MNTYVWRTAERNLPEGFMLVTVANSVDEARKQLMNYLSEYFEEEDEEYRLPRYDAYKTLEGLPSTVLELGQSEWISWEY